MFVDKTISRKLHEYDDMCRLMRTAGPRTFFRTMPRRYAAWPLSSRYSLMVFHPRSFLSLPSLYHSIYSPSSRENSSNGTPVQSLPSKKSHLWIGYTDMDSSERSARDGRAVYEGPQAPEASFWVGMVAVLFVALVVGAYSFLAWRREGR